MILLKVFKLSLLIIDYNRRMVGTTGKKRGRKPNKAKKTNKPPPKKRGRKPKGGKIIKNITDMDTNTIIKKQNVILHLKCSSDETKTRKIKGFWSIIRNFLMLRTNNIL